MNSRKERLNSIEKLNFTGWLILKSHPMNTIAAILLDFIHLAALYTAPMPLYGALHTMQG